MSNVPTVKLNNDVERPLLGFGTYQVTDQAEAERSVKEAIESGDRLIDTAASYGNEEAVGRGIASGGVSREELFITTKQAIATAHDKTIAQVIVRWLTQRGVIAIPKSVRKERMAENFDIFDFELTEDELKEIRGLDTETSSFFDHRDPNMVKTLSEAARPT